LWRVAGLAVGGGCAFLPGEVAVAASSGWRRSAVLTVVAVGDDFGVWQGDMRGRVRPVFGMWSGRRGLLTQLCGCSRSRRVNAPLARLLRDGR
jgi:hypothetical protein